MRPLSEMPMAIASQIRVVFADIDDTLTTNGRLPASAYSALETLKDIGIRVVPVTGRPAGWCDMIARFWPVDGCVGENGAMYFSYDTNSKTMRRVYAASVEEREQHRTKLQLIADKILQEIPNCAVSADQDYREVDLAIDFCEDVPPLPSTEILRIKTIFENAGATAKISSIHVNGWFGHHDKLSMTRRFAHEVLGIDIDQERHRAIFCGDSPNDEPMFSHFPHACGVANVMDFKGQLKAEPSWVCHNRGGEGFAELATFLVAAHNQIEMRLSV